MRIVGLLVLALVLALGFDAVATTLTDEGKGQRAAESLGLQDVSVVKKSIAWPLAGCGRSDTTIITVQGTDPQGVERIISFCAGIWKGATFRSN